MKRLAILGSTGSIGEQTLEVVAGNPEAFEVTALAAGRRAEVLAEQVRRFRPALVSMGDADSASELRERKYDKGQFLIDCPGLKRKGLTQGRAIKMLLNIGVSMEELAEIGNFPVWWNDMFAEQGGTS